MHQRFDGTIFINGVRQRLICLLLLCSFLLFFISLQHRWFPPNTRVHKSKSLKYTTNYKRKKIVINSSNAVLNNPLSIPIDNLEKSLSQQHSCLSLSATKAKQIIIIIRKARK